MRFTWAQELWSVSVSQGPSTLCSTQQILNKHLMNEWKEGMFWRAVFFIPGQFTYVQYNLFQWFIQQWSLWNSYHLGRQSLPSQRMVLDQWQPITISTYEPSECLTLLVGSALGPGQTLCLFGEIEAHRDFGPFRHSFILNPQTQATLHQRAS